MSNVWFTSDQHIGHAKIAQIRLIASGVEADAIAEVGDQFITDWHDGALARRWDEAVAPEDTVWVLGDISSGTKQAQLNALEWFKQRPGRKHLVAGNHDNVHPMHRDAHQWFPLYLEAFETVQSAARRRIPLLGKSKNGADVSIGHVSALLSHFPYTGDHTRRARYTQWRLPDEGKDFILHGHTHSEERRAGRQIHVGVDAWGLRPVPLEAVVDLVNGRTHPKPRVWDSLADVPETVEVYDAGNRVWYWRKSHGERYYRAGDVPIDWSVPAAQGPFTEVLT